MGNVPGKSLLEGKPVENINQVAHKGMDRWALLRPALLCGADADGIVCLCLTVYTVAVSGTEISRLP